MFPAVRQMACHPDLVLRSKKAKYIANVGEEVVCRICNDVVSQVLVSSLFLLTIAPFRRKMLSFPSVTMFSIGNAFGSISR
jgi:hypothetical protein